MTRYRMIIGPGAIGALVFAPIAAAQDASGPSRAGDLELSCPALAVEMGKAAQLLAAAKPAASTEAPGTAETSGALGTLASKVGGTDKLEQLGRAYQQQQNAQELANLQVLAARGGVGRGTATAAIGGIAALRQMAVNGGNVQDAASAAAGDAVGNALASRIPGGKMVGSLMGGMFKKKSKVVPVAVTAAVAPVDNGAQARLTFLSGIVAAKGCK